MKVQTLSIQNMRSSRVFFELRAGNGGIAFLWSLVAILAGITIWSVFGWIDEWAQGTAILRPEVEIVKVRNDVSGRISRKIVDHGDSVRAGDTLWEIDTEVLSTERTRLNTSISALRREIEETRLIAASIRTGNLSQAQSSEHALALAQLLLFEQQAQELAVEAARDTWHRAVEAPAALRDPVHIREAERAYRSRQIEANQHIPRALSELTIRRRALESELEQAQQALVTTERSIEESRITAPVDGTVELLRDFAVGELAIATEELARIIPERADRFLLYVEVPEREAGEIAVGQQMVLRFSSFPVSEYGSARAQVTYVPRDSQVNSNGQRVFLLRGALDAQYLSDRRGNQYPLRPGMTAETRIIVRRTPVYRFLLQYLDFLS